MIFKAIIFKTTVENVVDLPGKSHRPEEQCQWAVEGRHAQIVGVADKADAAEGPKGDHCRHEEVLDGKVNFQDTFRLNGSQFFRIKRFRLKD